MKIILCTFSFQTLSVACALSYGTIFSEYLTQIQASSIKVSWIYNMYHVSACLGCLMVDTLVEEFGWRKVVFTASVVSSLGIALSAFTTSVDFLFFSYSLLAGTNNCSSSCGRNYNSSGISGDNSNTSSSCSSIDVNL